MKTFGYVGLNKMHIKTNVTCFFSLFIVFDREKEAEREQGRGRHRIRSRLRAVRTEPDAGLKPTNREVMTAAEVRRLTD